MRTIYGLVCASFVLFVSLPQSRAASVCDGISGNLVNNCGFETGDFTAWTLTGNDVPGELNNLYGVEGQDPVDGINPHSGNFQAFFADLTTNATTLSQTVATLASGEYTVSWYLAQDTPATTEYGNAFSATLDGITLASLTDVPVDAYTEYSDTVVVTDANAALALTLGNDLGEFLLDDVSVVATPEPSAWKLALGGALLGFVMFHRKRLQRGVAL
jgi:hypothetical protein